MFQYNLQLSKQFLAKIKQYPKFYQELIQIWAKASGNELSRTSEVCEEVLWNNKMITSNGDSLSNKHYIYSMSISLVFHWYGLIKSIPTTWKDELQRDTPHCFGNNRDKHCIITSKEAPKIYNISTNCTKFTNHVLGLTDINWKKVYMLPRQV